MAERGRIPWGQRVPYLSMERSRSYSLAASPTLPQSSPSTRQLSPLLVGSAKSIPGAVHKAPRSPVGHGPPQQRHGQAGLWLGRWSEHFQIWVHRAEEQVASLLRAQIVRYATPPFGTARCRKFGNQLGCIPQGCSACRVRWGR
jgi:hypothetical protein